MRAFYIIPTITLAYPKHPDTSTGYPNEASQDCAGFTVKVPHHDDYQTPEQRRREPQSGLLLAVDFPASVGSCCIQSEIAP
jgi:hypothetical protein